MKLPWKDDPDHKATEEEDVEESASCLEKLLARKLVKLIIFCTYFGYGLFCIIVDWLWVSDTLKVEKALVFGPPGLAITVTLIVVVSLGTISYTCELTNCILKNFYGKQIVEEDIAEVVTLFVEEVPTVTLNALLASCREVPLSYFQLLKAALGMFGALFRCLRVLARYFQVRRRGKKTGLLPFILRVIILCACLYCLVGSIMVWVFTFYDTSGDFRQPDSIYTKVYDDGRYLYKSGVYFSHPLFIGCNNNTDLWNTTYAQTSWLKMEGIYDIQDSVEAEFVFYYDEDSNNTANSITHMHTVWPGDRPDDHHWFKTLYPECATSQLHTVPDELPPHYIHFKFEDTERDKTRVFGDIKFKAIIVENDTCDYLSTDEWGYLRSSYSVRAQAQFHYLKVFDDVNDNVTYFDDNGIYRPYMLGEEAQNVTDVWKTGYNECDMTGALRPNPDDNIDLHCESLQREITDSHYSDPALGLVASLRDPPPFSPQL